MIKKKKSSSETFQESTDRIHLLSSCLFGQAVALACWLGSVVSVRGLAPL